MQSSTERLMEILKSFRSATESKDWERVGELDASFRVELGTAVAGIGTDAEREELARFLKRAQAIYELVKTGAEKHKAQIAQELTRLSKDQKAVASYQKSMHLR